MIGAAKVLLASARRGGALGWAAAAQRRPSPSESANDPGRLRRAQCSTRPRRSCFGGAGVARRAGGGARREAADQREPRDHSERARLLPSSRGTFSSRGASVAESGNWEDMRSWTDPK